MFGKMLKFLYHFVIGIFAILGVVVALAMVSAGLFIYRSMETPATPAPDLVLTATLEGPMEESAGGDPLQGLFHGSPASFGMMVDALDVASADPHIKGILLDVGRSELGFAQNEELRQALKRFRRTGRFAIAFADSFGEMDSATGAYHLATAFDEIWVQPVGLVGLTGIGIEGYFARDALSKLGISFDMRTRKDYKTAADMLTKSAMTPANRDMLESLVQDISATVLEDIVAARHIPLEKLETLVAKAPLTAEDALETHLIDGIAHSETVFEDTLSRAGSDADSMDLFDYLASHAPNVSGDQKNIALIYATGEIRRGTDGSMAPFSENTLGQAETVAAEIMDATDDENVAAIVLRVDSPGGSAVASETVRGAILRARASNIPVVVSMGNTAASGGYWIAMDANRIIAQNTTLTGSIGVLAGKPVAQELLTKLGVSWEGVSSGENALMWSPARPFTPEESTHIDTLVDAIYEQFKTRVAAARGLSPEEVEMVAQGRVWTGRQALGLHLVDGIGGLHEAWLAARETAGISRQQDVPLIPYARKDGILASLRRLFMDFRGLGFGNSHIRAWLGLMAGDASGTAHMQPINIGH
ncbi:MAG: hypothetical protein A2018_00455 [Alphaproteobacteria bacterium GWF2_58_20]|nr:MAG: hypothetical protein A2018_00455 [Alphaproteobacteria bacterium GWF2_58_20]